MPLRGISSGSCVSRPPDTHQERQRQQAQHKEKNESSDYHLQKQTGLRQFSVGRVLIHQHRTMRLPSSQQISMTFAVNTLFQSKMCSLIAWKRDSSMLPKQPGRSTGTSIANFKIPYHHACGASASPELPSMSRPAAEGPESPCLRHLREGYLQCFAADGRAGFPQTAEPLLLAISGGADSMALLHGTLQLLAASSTPLPIHAIHINHGLRAADSDQDAEFVQQACQRHGVPCRLETVQAQIAHAASAGMSLEEAARSVRYERLTAAASDLGAHYVVTAHHRDDQAETILHNILRGTGLQGLQGMTASRALGPPGSPASRLRLIRPLLHCSRDELRDYLLQSQVPFREDASNLDLRFTRNRIRHELLPLLKRVFNPQADRHLVELGRHAADALTCLDEIADRLLQDALLELSASSCRLYRSRLTTAPDFLQRHALTRLWQRLHWPRQSMTAAHWKRLSTTITSGSPASLALPGQIQLRIRGDLAHLAGPAVAETIATGQQPRVTDNPEKYG